MKKGLKKFISVVLSATMMCATLSFGTTVSFAAQNISTVKVGGWMESSYLEWTGGAANYTGYNAYVKNAGDSNWTQLDDMLIRRYADRWRVDAVGLTPGSYDMKVVPVSNGAEITDDALVENNIEVTAYDRSGAAFAANSTFKGAGAYNTDGTLKTGAKVIYVTPENAKTVKASIMYDKAETEFTGFQAIMDALQKGKETAPIDVRIVGTIKASDMDKFSSSEEGLQIKGKNAYSNMNLTIEGIGEDSGVHGFGVFLRNCGNVELRNFAVMDCMDDSISLDTDNCNLWVHNLDLYYGQTGGAADQAKGDGTVDLKADTKNVTISYNHFYDSGKCSLGGMKSEVETTLNTYHHNWFDHSDSRHPRIRTMSMHIYNNYYDGISKYGVGASKNGSAFVENNYFRNNKYPVLQGGNGHDADGKGGSNTFDDSPATGVIKFFNNTVVGTQTKIDYDDASTTVMGNGDCYKVSSRNEQIPSTYSTALGAKYNNFDTSSSFDLNVPVNMIDAPEDVPAKVMAYAGRVNGGDFKWTFDNTVEDTNYSVIPALKAAVQGYTSSIVAFGGQGSVVVSTTTTESTSETSTLAPVPGTTETSTQITTQITTSVEPTSELTTVAVTPEEGFSPAGVTPDGTVSVSYQAASNDYLLTDTASNAAATWRNSFEPITSGKVVIKGYATPQIAKATSKWAFVQIRGTSADGTEGIIAALSSDTSKLVSLRTDVNAASGVTTSYTSTSNEIAATKYNYEITIDLDAKTATLNVNGTKLTHAIDCTSISSVYNITATSATDRNLIVSAPIVGIPGTTGPTTETSTEGSTLSTETSTQGSTVSTESSSTTTTQTTEPTTGAPGPHTGGGDITEHQLPATVVGTDTANTKVIFDNTVTGKFTASMTFDVDKTEGTGGVLTLCYKNAAGEIKDLGDLGLNLKAKTGETTFGFSSGTVAAGNLVAGSNTVTFSFDPVTMIATCNLNGTVSTKTLATAPENICGFKVNKKTARTVVITSVSYSGDAPITTESSSTTTETSTETSTTTVSESSSTTTEISTTTETSTEISTSALVKGDSDNNGTVEANDAAMMIQKVLTDVKTSMENATDKFMDYIDVDKDGKLTSIDAAYIMQKALDSTFLMPNEK